MPKTIDSGIVEEAIILAGKIRSVFDRKAVRILEQDPEEHCHTMPKINTEFARYVEGKGTIRVNFVSGGDGIGYGESYSIKGNGKEVLGSSPEYVGDHYKGRPEDKPFIGKALHKASLEIHELLTKDEGFQVKNERTLNRYFKN